MRIKRGILVAASTALGEERAFPLANFPRSEVDEPADGLAAAQTCFMTISRARL